MAGVFKLGGKTVATHDESTDVVSLASDVDLSSIVLTNQEIRNANIIDTDIPMYKYDNNLQLYYRAWDKITNVSGDYTLDETMAPLNSFVIIQVNASAGGYPGGGGTIEAYNNHVRYSAYKAPGGTTHYSSQYHKGLVPILTESDRTIYWHGRIHAIEANNEFYVHYKGYIQLGRSN